MDRDEEHAGYSGLAAELYDQLRGESPLRNEFEFYRQWLQCHPGPALEVSCGTGRILLRLLAAGFDIDGMDASEDMLRLCRGKADALGLSPVLYRQLMQRMAIPRDYVTILVPLASFMLLTKMPDAVQALDCFFRHLKPGGHLLFSTHLPRTTTNSRSDWVICGSVLHPSRGVVRISVASEADHQTQTATDYHRFEVMDGKAVVETAVHSIRLRWYRESEMIAMLEAAGFRNIAVWGDHADRAATADDTVLVFDGCRPSA